MANWAKLSDGTWGLRGTATELRPGAQVTVVRADGSRSTVEVGTVRGRIGGGIVLAEVARAPRRPRAARQAPARRQAPAPVAVAPAPVAPVARPVRGCLGLTRLPVAVPELPLDPVADADLLRFRGLDLGEEPRAVGSEPPAREEPIPLLID